MIHLDTSFLVDFLRETRRGRAGPATNLLDALPLDEVRISVFAVCELMVGPRLFHQPTEELERVRRLCKAIPVRYPDSRFPENYARLLSDLRRRGLNVQTMDLLIATAAVTDRARLVTGNIRHFVHFTDLELLGYDSQTRSSGG